MKQIALVLITALYTASLHSQTVIGKIHTQLDINGKEKPSDGYFKISLDDMSIRMYDKNWKQLIYRKITKTTLTKQHPEKKEYGYQTNEGGIVSINIWDNIDVMSVQIVTKENDYYAYICDLTRRY